MMDRWLRLDGGTMSPDERIYIFCEPPRKHSLVNIARAGCSTFFPGDPNVATSLINADSTGTLRRDWCEAFGSAKWKRALQIKALSWLPPRTDKTLTLFPKAPLPEPTDAGAGDLRNRASKTRHSSFVRDTRRGLVFVDTAMGQLIHKWVFRIGTHLTSTFRMACQTTSVRPVLQQIITGGPWQSRLPSSPLLRAAPLLAHEASPTHDIFSKSPKESPASLHPQSATSFTLPKAHRRTGSLLRQKLTPLSTHASPLSTQRVDTTPVPQIVVTVSPTFCSPILAALAESEEPRSDWPHPELQKASMEEAASKTRHLRIDPRRIRTEEEHAHSWGSFGEVWRCWLTGKTAGELERVAVKKIHLRPEHGRSNRKLLRHLLREVLPWYELDHPNITPFIGYIFDGRSARMLSKWQEGGNVRDYMQRYTMNGLRAAQQVATGLAYLHGRDPPIVHGDIKPENILIGADGVAALVDFGLSMILDDTLSRGLRTSSGCRHTLLYADPVLLDDVPRTTHTDVWALGWIIWELVTRRMPYDHCKSTNAIFRAVVSYELPTRNSHQIPYPELIWPVLEACWSKDLSQRWSAKSVEKYLCQALAALD